MDRKDEKILEILRKNGRANYVDIAKEVELASRRGESVTAFVNKREWDRVVGKVENLKGKKATAFADRNRAALDGTQGPVVPVSMQERKALESIKGAKQFSTFISHFSFVRVVHQRSLS